MIRSPLPSWCSVFDDRMRKVPRSQSMSARRNARTSLGHRKPPNRQSAKIIAIAHRCRQLAPWLLPHGSQRNPAFGSAGPRFPSCRQTDSLESVCAEMRHGTFAERSHNVCVRSSGSAGQSIALTLLLGNQEEVALAEFAQQQSQNPKVKEFAALMIKDHQPALKKLQQLSSHSQVSGSGGVSMANGSSAAQLQGAAPNSSRARTAEVIGSASDSSTSIGSPSTEGFATVDSSPTDADQFQQQARSPRRSIRSTSRQRGSMSGGETACQLSQRRSCRRSHELRAVVSAETCNKINAGSVAANVEVSAPYDSTNDLERAARILELCNHCRRIYLRGGD